jgi:predicted transcriptional regulator
MAETRGDTSRVQRWREGKRKAGLKAVTVWLTTEEELRLKDLALQWHCSPSALMQQALAQFSSQTPPGISIATDASQIRELIRAELTTMQAETVPVTDTVTEVVTAMLVRDLPAMVRQLVEGLARYRYGQ